MIPTRLKNWWRDSLVSYQIKVYTIALGVIVFMVALQNAYQVHLLSTQKPVLRQYPDSTLECVLFDNRIINCWKLEK